MGDEEGEVVTNPATGDVYEGGRNEEGERHGEGVAKYANGDVYKVRADGGTDSLRNTPLPHAVCGAVGRSRGVDG